MKTKLINYKPGMDALAMQRYWEARGYKVNFVLREDTE